MRSDDDTMSKPDDTELTHLDHRGHARMVDVGKKAVTRREARAIARVSMNRTALGALAGGTLEKGDALTVARLAGIQAAKRTAEWIPLCHPLPLDAIEVTIQLDEREGEAVIHTAARVEARTGVEMEALVAASAAALTLIDMAKSVDRAMVIEEVRLESKQGGRRGDFVHPRSSGKPPRRPDTP